MDNRLVLRQALLGEGTPQERPSQLKMANDAARAVDRGVCAVFQAPTGIGKTRVLLYAGIVHVLNNLEHNKSLYVAKTLPQLRHVSEEVEKHLAPAIQHAELANIIFVGIGLGSKPMIDRICSRHFGNDIVCDSCPLGNQRNRPAIKTGPASLRHYGIAVRSGRCPYAYMRDSLKESNLIIGTHAYVNHEFWLSRTFGSLRNLRNVCVLIDEAHNYVDDITQKPIIEIRSDNTSKKSRYRQAESDISLPDLYSNFVDKIARILAWIAFREEVESAIGTSSVDFGEMMYQLGIELRAACIQRDRYRNIRDRILSIEQVWKQGQGTDEGDRRQLIRMIEVQDGRFSQLVSDYESTFANIEERKSEMSQVSNEISRRIHLMIDAREAWKTTKSEFDKAKERGDLGRDLIERQNQAFDKMRSVSEEQQPIVDALKASSNELDSLLTEAEGEQQTKLEKIRTEQSFVFDAVNRGFERTSELGELREKIKDFTDGVRVQINGSESTDDGALQQNELLILAITVASSLRHVKSLLSTFGGDSGTIRSSSELVRESFQTGIDALLSIENSVADDYVDWLSDTRQLLSVFADIATFPRRFYLEHKTVNVSNEQSVSRIMISDLDVEEKVRRYLDRYHSVIMCSATLSPARLTGVLLGWPDAIAGEYAPVFPRSNYCVHGFVGFNTGKAYANTPENSRASPEQIEYLKRTLPKIVHSLRGNVGCFVCSESFLKDAYEILAKEADWDSDIRHLLLSNANRDLDDDYEELAADFDLPTHKSLDFDGEWKRILQEDTKNRVVVWFATTGKFSEGVDFPGEELSSAILIGIPYPNTTDVRELLEARVEYYRELKSTELADLVEEVSFHIQPFRKLCQAAGRIHRRPDDRGTVTLLDDRIFGINSSVSPDGRVHVKHRQNMDESSLRYKILPARIREQMVLIDSTGGQSSLQKRRLAESYPGVILGSFRDFELNVENFYRGDEYRHSALDRIRDYYLSNIDYAVPRELLLTELKKVYDVVSLSVPRGKGKNLNRGFAFVTISSADSSESVVAGLGSIKFRGRFVKASLQRTEC